MLGVSYRHRGAAALAKSIRKDTLGLEPHEIAALYRERNAMLLAMKEGIIAVNKEGAVTMMNLSAADMLNLPAPMIGRHIKEIMPGANLMPVLAGENYRRTWRCVPEIKCLS